MADLKAHLGAHLRPARAYLRLFCWCRMAFTERLTAAAGNL
jgi:hypothetical protein